MYDVPSRKDVVKCVVSEETVLHRKRPLLVSKAGHVIADDDEADEGAEVQESA
jgi:ATP-dependent Clp protease ATP-binding subunit ClpX